LGSRSASQVVQAGLSPDIGARSISEAAAQVVSRAGCGLAQTSIRLDQAPFITQIRSALMRVLASSISFRMSAVMATFGGFPALIKA
jgi:hypothetical protein